MKRELTDAQIAELVDYRGGCRCHLSPPCPAHSDPLTQDEIDELGFDEELITDPAKIEAAFEADQDFEDSARINLEKS